MIKVSPSLLTADFGYIAETVRMLDSSGADWIHCDVMDNVFVPSMSFGQSMIRAIRKATHKPLDVHLMIHEPLSKIAEYAECGADIITVHIESSSSHHSNRLVNAVRKTGKKVGIAINPGTHPDVLEYLYDYIDLVLVMSVNPGYGGQSFIPNSLRKIEHIANRTSQLNVDVEIEVDGGVSVENAKDIVSAGADILVAGSAVVDSASPKEVISLLQHADE